MAASPDNYYIGKGILTIGGTDIGNVPEIELTPQLEFLDHFSSREGIRKKDKSVVIEQGLTLRIVVEEFTAGNLRYLLMGSAVASDNSFEIFTETEITGAVVFTGTNTIGKQITLNLPNVSFKPSGSLNLISDEWGSFELTGDVLVSEDSDATFGTVTVSA